MLWIRKNELKEKYVKVVKIEKDIRKKFHNGFKRKDKDIHTFIVHCTGGGSTAKGVIDWMIKGGPIGGGKTREEDYKKGVALFQYLVDRDTDGSIYEIINPHNWVYHSSTGSWDANTIGVESVNPDPNNKAELTEKQYESIAFLFEFWYDLVLKAGGKISSIYGHGAYKKKKSGQYKECPGKGFNWNKLGTLLENRRFKFTKGEECFTDIQKI